MKYEVTVYSLRRVLRNMGDAVLDVAAALREGSWAFGRRAEEMRSRMRLEKEVRDIHEEIDLQMRAVGEIMYATHKGSPSDSGRVQEILEYVDGLNEELEAHRREQETLKGRLVCPECGAPNRPECLYCQSCGKPLSR